MYYKFILKINFKLKNLFTFLFIFLLLFYHLLILLSFKGFGMFFHLCDLLYSRRAADVNDG